MKHIIYLVWSLIIYCAAAIVIPMHRLSSRMLYGVNNLNNKLGLKIKELS